MRNGNAKPGSAKSPRDGASREPDWQKKKANKRLPIPLCLRMTLTDDAAISDLRGGRTTLPSAPIRSRRPNRRSAGHQWRGSIHEEIVELRAGLSANFKHVFKSGGGYQCNSSAATLQ